MSDLMKHTPTRRRPIDREGYAAEQARRLSEWTKPRELPPEAPQGGVPDDVESDGTQNTGGCL